MRLRMHSNTPPLSRGGDDFWVLCPQGGGGTFLRKQGGEVQEGEREIFTIQEGEVAFSGTLLPLFVLMII